MPLRRSQQSARMQAQSKNPGPVLTAREKKSLKNLYKGGETKKRKQHAKVWDSLMSHGLLNGCSRTMEGDPEKADPMSRAGKIPCAGYPGLLMQVTQGGTAELIRKALINGYISARSRGIVD